jgi:hypothetical protein
LKGVMRGVPNNFATGSSETEISPKDTKGGSAQRIPNMRGAQEKYCRMTTASKGMKIGRVARPE